MGSSLCSERRIDKLRKLSILAKAQPCKLSLYRFLSPVSYRQILEKLAGWIISIFDKFTFFKVLKVQKNQASLLYKIAITLLPNVGPVLARNLISYCGGVEEVFKVKHARLVKVPGIGEITAREISGSDVLKEAEEEIQFITKQNIQPLFYLDENYPARLKHCNDAPLMLYYKGNAELNAPRVVGIVG